MMWRSAAGCQPAETVVIAVAGVAGSGKSTLGKALAAALGAPLLDLDSMTNPLLDRLPDEITGGHWLVSPHRRAIRDGRYAVLRAVTREVVATAGQAVLVAPFTAELTGGAEWDLLRDAAGAADVCVVHIAGDDELFAARRSQRSEARDQHRIHQPATAPAVPVVTVDGELSTDQQLLRVLAALGRRADVDASNALFDREFDAVLFDLDGTLADSTASALRSRRRFAQESGLPAVGAHSADRITDLEVADARSVQPTLGAQSLFRSVPEQRRAIVASGPSRLAAARIRAVGLPMPPVVVTVDDVGDGGPEREPYRLAAQRMGVDPHRCLVVEDTVAGLRAARAAGCAVVAVTGTACAEDLAEADLVVDGLDRLRLVPQQGALRLTVTSGQASSAR